MAKENLDFKSVPNGYLMCFATACPLRDDCMRFLAGQAVPASVEKGYCVFPTACKDGKCRYFSKVRMVQAVRGFGDLFREVRRSDYAAMKAGLRGIIGTGGSYYRYKRGDKLLMPEMQEQIRELFRRYGYSDDVAFGETVTTYDFS